MLDVALVIVLFGVVAIPFLVVWLIGLGWQMVREWLSMALDWVFGH